MRKLFLSLILISIGIDMTAQPINQLSVGDKLPQSALNYLLNYKSAAKGSHGTKGKLIILDFWGVTCKACIESMPKMEALQNKFQDKIQVILVTNDDSVKVNKLIRKNRIVREVKLPFIVSDTLLSSLFYFQTVPTHVWIDSLGNVQYITEGWDTNEKNIKAFLRGEHPRIAIKMESPSFSAKDFLHLTQMNNQYAPYLRMYSFFMSNIKGAVRTSSIEKIPNTDKLAGVTFINQLPLNLFMYAYSESNLPFEDYRRIILEGKRATNLKGPTDLLKRSEWTENQPISYHIKLSNPLSNDVYKYMQQDLSRYFHVVVTIEKRKLPCLVLNKIGPIDKIYTKKGNAICFPKNDSLILRNCSVRNFIYWLNSFTSGKKNIPIFMDSTGIVQNIDLELPLSVFENFNIDNINLFLENKGLQFVKRELFLDMLVIKDE